jgi:SsrA-binding protein
MPRKDPQDNVIARNRKAFHDYQILESFETGIALQGTEVKSCRDKGVSINECYAKIDNGQLTVMDMNIAPYVCGNRFNHDPVRPRKLLMKKKDILKLSSKIKEKGLSLIPLKLYLKKGIIKVELGLGKGKSFEDKRDTLRKRQDDMDMRRATGHKAKYSE